MPTDADVAHARQIAARAVEAAAAEMEPHPDGCRACDERDQPVRDALYAIAHELRTQER